MKPDEIVSIFQNQVLALIDAKLKPVTGMMLGFEIALLHLFNCLHHKGVLSQEAALISLAATRENLPPDVPEEAHLMLKHIEGWFAAELAEKAAKRENSPEVLRTKFRIIPGHLNDERQKDTD